jgi:hypothetical protein
MAKGDIKLHPEYGLNPTMPVCFWCGKNTGEIVLLGRRYKGKAPRRMWLGDYTPCGECASRLKPGPDRVVIMECSRTPTLDNQPSMHEDQQAYPTGRYVVFRVEALERIFNPEGVKAVEDAGNKCLLEPEAFEVLFGHLDDSDE